METNEELGDKSEGLGPTAIWGKGYILDIAQTEVICPICSCQQDLCEKIEKAKIPEWFRAKCQGCKRWLRISSDMTGKLTVWEIINRHKKLTPFK